MCSTPWRDQLPSGKPTFHSYDYFICPYWNIAQVLTLPEFSDSLIDFWPSALEMLDRDPGELSFAVGDVLSGTGARVSSTNAVLPIYCFQSRSRYAVRGV
jgi:hypothetical protein